MIVKLNSLEVGRSIGVSWVAGLYIGTLHLVLLPKFKVSVHIDGGSKCGIMTFLAPSQ